MKFKSITAAVLICFLWISCFGCANNNVSEGTILRLHIRADSNNEADQEVKLKVRDKVSVYLEDELGDCKSLEAALTALEGLKTEIKRIADGVLSENGFDYVSSVKINNEYFPTRMYESVVVESGYYDALIINLGSGGGDNWWCVIYPPLCYVEAQYGDGFRYKSKIKELIDKYFG